MNNDDFSAEFDLDSYLIRVIDNQEDFSIDSLFEESNKIKNDYSTPPLDLHLKAFYANQSHEYLIDNPLSNLPQNARHKIIHENMHFIQANSYTFIITRFLSSLKLMRYHAKHKKIPRFRLYPDTLLVEDKDYSSILYIYFSSKMNFNYLKDLGKPMISFAEEVYPLIKEEYGCKNNPEILKCIEKKSGIKGLGIYEKFYNIHGIDIISEDPPTATLFTSIPHLEKDKIFYAYIGILDYYFPIEFSITNVLESMAYISEKIKNDERIREINLLNEDDRKYLGVWEFYRRIFSARYDSERELALSFLAICDLSLTTDITPNEEDVYYEEDHLMNTNFPYRFGKIIFRSQGIPTLNLINNNMEKSIIDFQDKYCKYSGMLSIDDSIKKMILHLAHILITDLCFLTEIDSEEFVSNYKLIRNDLKNNWYLIYNIINRLNYYNSKTSGAISIAHNTIGTIFNTLILKLNNRGKFALLPIYFEEINALTPSPYILYNGEFYSDFRKFHYIGQPYKISYLSEQQDHLMLFLSKPLIYGENECTFLRRNIDCFYTKNGLGCPLKKLTQKEISKRCEFKNLNWCYWEWFKIMLNEK